MTVYVVYSKNMDLCEVFETFDAAEDFRKRNGYTNWNIAQRDVRKK